MVGNRYDTQIILMNPQEQPVEGKIDILGPAGKKMKIAGQDTWSYRLEAGAVGLFELKADGEMPGQGFAVIRTSSSSLPVGGALLRVREGDLVVRETYVKGAPQVRRAWIPVDTYRNVSRHGEIDVRVALVNPNSIPATVSLRLIDLEGKEVARHEKQFLPAYNQQQFSVAELFGRNPFKGVWTVTSDMPLAISAQQVTVNIQNDEVATEIPFIDPSAEISGKLLLPKIEDGEGMTTQIFLLNAGQGFTEGKIRFFESGGQDWTLILR